MTNVLHLSEYRTPPIRSGVEPWMDLIDVLFSERYGAFIAETAGIRRRLARVS